MVKDKERPRTRGKKFNQEKGLDMIIKKMLKNIRRRITVINDRKLVENSRIQAGKIEARKS